MANDLNEKVVVSIQNLREKKSKIYFLVQDTKGNAKASVRYIYQMALSLKNGGFNPIILHEKNDYSSVIAWLDQEYTELPHKSIEGQNLEVTPDDFLIIPEIFGYVMDQVKKLPCAKIVLTQSYAYMLETLQPGQSWSQFGFYKCITTSLKQKEYIEKIMRQNTFDIIEPYITDSFHPKPQPPMPIIGIHTRDHSDTINTIKAFYLKFPQYRWFTFRDLRGLSEKEFGNSLRDCFMSVWIDDDCSFGTFPLESMVSNVPVVGKIPNIVPEWMNDENGIWINDKTVIVDVIADFIQNWLEDNINPELYSEMEKTSKNYNNKSLFESKVNSLFDSYFNQRAESFEQQLSKTEN
jgi:hypothetical protein